jgi:hypothetical protein
MRKARMGSMDAARRAGKNAAANVTIVMPTNARRIVRGSLELKPYSMERKVVATARAAGMPTPSLVVRVTSVENLEVEETAANHCDHRRVVMEVVDGPHDAAPNHANKYRDSGFQMF